MRAGPGGAHEAQALAKTLVRAQVGLLRACPTMSCVDGVIPEGMEIDLDAGPRLNYWLTLNNQMLQYSGTARPEVLKIAGQDPKRLAGTLAIDDTAASGPKVDVEFAATLLKEITAAR